jgi:hypothetical protein
MKLEGAKSGLGAPSQMLAEIGIFAPIRPFFWANSLKILRAVYLKLKF